jgi:capsular polysaccharide biosynthesis protein
LRKIDYFLVPGFELEFQIKTLQILGIQKKQILESQKYKHLLADEIYSTSSIADDNSNNIFNWNINFIRKTYLSAAQNRKSHFNYKKIYLDRGEGHLIKNIKNLYSLKDNYRLIINEDEIKSYLISKGFKIIKSQDLFFLDQVDLFSNLDCIISLHGAGLTNLIFSKPKTKVIEIRTENNINNFPYKLSKLLKLNYHSINLKTVYKTKATQNGLIFCPLQKIVKVMNLLKI